MGCTPIIKWAGGKRQLLSDIKSLMPSSYKDYYEPFFGGGALFFDIEPSKAYINDFNPFLVNLYQQIAKNNASVMKYANDLQSIYNKLSDKDSKAEYYFKIRDLFNTHIKNNTKTAETAAMLLFLNKACFNGLYRVNSNGLFNVPSGHKSVLNLYDADNMKHVSKILSKAVITNTDFEKACKSAKCDDFVFFDSPYYDTFDTYQANGFSELDHVRLSDLYKNLTSRGVYCMLTNSNTDFIKNLYKDFNIKVVDVKRMINRDKNNRVGKEIIVINY